MLQTLTMTAEQEARDKAFYLLKKYTSFTFLDKARELYQGFLDAVERQLNNPQRYRPDPPNRYEIHYKRHLSQMILL